MHAQKFTAYIAAVVADAPPLTPAQRDRLAVLLAPPAHTPGLSPSSPVVSAGIASHRFSGGSRAHPTTTAPQRPTHPERRPLMRPGFGATPVETT